MEEGSTLLPALRQTADAKELDRLGRAFEQRRAEELKALSGSASGSPDGATKAELHERAQQADVPGPVTDGQARAGAGFEEGRILGFRPVGRVGVPT
ncbi:hypothetical protein [Nonomuraea sp. NPDC049504]|uniref:hypothetical protein n=1 Tax=Nonomuraea sp. NPDC049504 TaxID=3154729 RepID=UPI003430AD57